MNSTKNFIDIKKLDSQLEEMTKYKLDITNLNFSDATEPIQNFLDKVNLSGGGVAVIPPSENTYILKTTLYIPDNVILDATGAKVKLDPSTFDYMVCSGIQRKILKTPKNVVATPSTDNGALVAGTYAYRVTAINSIGETMPCSEVVVVLSGTGKVILTWDTPTQRPEASPLIGYKIYGRTSGNIDRLLDEVGLVNTFVDTGAVGTASALPTTNTTYGRQSLFKVIGGSWDASHRSYGRPSDGEWQNDNWAGHAFAIEHCDTIEFTNVVVKNAAKWCIAISDFEYITADHLTFDSDSDGIHCLGPGKRMILNDTKGTVGDDMIGVSLVEWPPQAASEGSIDEVVINDVYVEEGFSALRVLGGTNTTLGNITVKHVRGTLKGTQATAGLYINNDQDAPNRAGTVVGKIRIEDVNLTWVDSPTKPIVHIAPTSTEDVYVSDVTGYGNGRVVCKIASGIHKKVRYEKITGRNGDGITALLVGSGSSTTIDSLIVDDIDLRNEFNTSSVCILFGASVTVNTVSLNNIKIKHTNYTGKCIDIVGATVRNLSVLNSYADKTESFLDMRSGSLGTTFMNNVITTCVDSLKIQRANTEFHFSGIASFSTNSFLSLIGASATGIRIRTGRVQMTKYVVRDGTQTIRCDDSAFQFDIRLAGLGLNDTFKNTYSGADVGNIGTGIVVSDGTLWKNMFTGATYTP